MVETAHAYHEFSKTILKLTKLGNKLSQYVDLGCSLAWAPVRGYLNIESGFEPGLELGLEPGLDSGLEPKMTSSDFDG